MNFSPNPGSHYFGKDLEAMSFAQNYHRWILSEFSPYIQGVVAEVGAGIGDFSQLLLTCSIDKLVAFEPSANMFPILNRSLPSDPRVDKIQACFGHAGETAEYNTIVYVNVLEHIEADDLELRRAHQALTEKGHLLIFVPALSCLYSDLDKQLGHYRRYRKRSLIQLVQTAGFEIVKAKYFDVMGILPWYINFVLLKNSMNSTSVSLYDTWIVPPMRVIEGILSPPMGKNVILIAKKQDGLFGLR